MISQYNQTMYHNTPGRAGAGAAGAGEDAAAHDDVRSRAAMARGRWSHTKIPFEMGQGGFNMV